MTFPSFPRQAGVPPATFSDSAREILTMPGSFPPGSREFVAALGGCVGPGAYPHPVTARNLGLVPAWRRWTAGHENRADGQSAADQLIADPGRRVDECAKLIKTAIGVDPVWRSMVANAGPGRVLDMGVDFATAPLMFWRRRHALIELTPALQRLLAHSDLGDDIPVDLFRPPMPACYIRFGDTMQHSALLPTRDGHTFTRIDGVYVFETVCAGERGLAIIAIYDVGGHNGLGVSGLTVVIRNEKESLMQVVERIAVNESPACRLHHQTLAKICTKIFLYRNVEQVRRIEETPYSDALRQLKGLGPKKAAKLGRKDQLYDRVLLGPLALPVHSHASHGDIAPHWRRGHFRMQPYGPQQSLRKVIFIAPMLIRADRLGEQGCAPDTRRHQGEVMDRT